MLGMAGDVETGFGGLIGSREVQGKGFCFYCYKGDHLDSPKE